MPLLFTADDLRAFLQYEIAAETVDVVDRIVNGWLLGATRLAELPFPLPDDLWADALELGALLASNPESLSQRTAGPTTRSWPMAPRRDAILQRVAGRYSSAARLGPTGAFPRVRDWPDPVERWAR